MLRWKALTNAKMLQVNLLGLVVVAGWAVLAAAVEVPTIPRLLGSSALPVPAFSEFWLSDDTSKPIVDRYTLYMSSFKPLAFAQTDSVWYTRSPGRYLDDVSAWKWELLDKTSYWPNNPDYLPREVLGFEGVVQTSGFLVPSKTRGKLQFYDMSAAVPNTTTINIASADPRDYSYHRVQFRDMDGDGDLDAITARFHNTNQEQNFLWMENPGQPVGGWTQHIMVQGGPDVHFVNVKLNSSGVPYDCYFGSELWQQRLSLHCVLESIPYAWTDPSNIRTISIDDTTGGCFDVVLSDLDQDGKLDVLLTSFNDSLRAGFVYVYQIPDDLFYGKWDRYTIGQDFIPTPGSNRMSPGKPEPYYPTVEYANEILPDGRNHRKWIMLSGDDDGHIYILRPQSEAIGDWRLYERTDMLDTAGVTTGKMALADINDDGYMDVVVAGYSANTVYFLTYAPAP